MASCFICGGGCIESICDNCQANPDSYDLYVLRFTELMNAIPGPIEQKAPQIKVPYWETEEYDKIKKEAKPLEKPQEKPKSAKNKKREEPPPGPGLDSFF